MGANQSKGQRHHVAEPSTLEDASAAAAPTSSFCGCFGSSSPTTAAVQDPSDDELKHAPEKQYRLSKGQVQPVRRSKMTLLGGRPDSMAAPPARHLSERRANKKRPGSRAKAQQSHPHHSQDVAPPVPAVPRPRDLLSPDDDESLLPHNRRLSPMPDFATYSYESMDQLGATPWVAVRQMAERMPSRRSSALALPAQSSPYASQRTSVAARQHSSTSTERKTSTSTSGPRKDSQLSVASTERKQSTSTSTSGQRDDPPPLMPPPPPRQTPAQATNMRIRTKFDIPQDVPMPLRSAKSTTESFDTTRVHAPSTRQPSPKLPPPKTFPLKSAMKAGRKSSIASPLSSPRTPQSQVQTPSSVEDAVRELQEIVEAKRGGGGSFDTIRTATTVQSNWRASEHRAAVAPGMVVRASTGLLDDIGSALSRPLSETTLTSQVRDEHQSTSPSTSKKPTLQKWRMRAASGATLESSPRHSGTFFFGGPVSRPTSSPTPTTRGSRANSGAESPVDTDWDADGRPFSEASLDAAALRHSLFPAPPGSAPLHGPAAVKTAAQPPRREPEQLQVQQLRPPQSRPVLRRSSSIAVANPVSHLSSISGLTTPSVRSHAADSIASFSFLDGASASSRGGGPTVAPEHSAAAVYAARSRTNGPGRGLGLTLRTSGFGVGPGPAMASRDDSSIASGRGGWPASPISAVSPQLPIMALPPLTPRSPANLTALPAVTGPTPAPAKPAAVRALAGVLRATPNIPNSARARRGGAGQGAGALCTVGEGAPVRLTAADVAGRRDASAARLADVEREVERIEMERGLARLSQ